jgi:hypothetical protein
MTTAVDLAASQELQDRGIRREFGNVHSRLDQFRVEVQDQFARIELRIANSEARMLNERALSSWQVIYPVGVFATLATGMNIVKVLRGSLTRSENFGICGNLKTVSTFDVLYSQPGLTANMSDRLEIIRPTSILRHLL